MTELIIYLIFSILLSFPVSHVFMKKGMDIDITMPNEEKYKTLSLFFYIPILNVVVTFLYLLWIIITFKR